MENAHEKRGYLLEDFRLFHLRDDRGTQVEYHYHEFHKLILLISGSGVYTVEGKRYQLRPGDVVLIGSHSVHKPDFAPGQPYERVILYIDPAFLQAHSNDSWSLEGAFSGEKGHVLRLGEGNPFYGLLEELEQELSGQAGGWEIAARGLLLRLCVALGRTLEGDVLRPRPMEPKNRRIQEILSYLDEHLEESISIEELAQRFYVSKYHMMRLFRQETGTTIHGYLTDKRLLWAREQISQGIPAAQACFQSGFQSYSAFSRAYGKRFGMTPMGRGGGGKCREETYE